MSAIGDWWNRLWGREPIRTLSQDSPAFPSRRSENRTIMTSSSTITINGKKVDASSVPGLNEEVMEIISRNMDKPEALNELLQKRLSEAGLLNASESAPGSPELFAMHSAEDVAKRFRKLDKLREAGLLSETEYAEQRRRILESI